MKNNITGYSKKWQLGETITIAVKEDGEMSNPQLYKLPCNDLLITYQDEGDLILTTTKMFRSKDNGKTWEKQDCPLPEGFGILDIGEDVVRLYDYNTFLVKDSYPKKFLYWYCTSYDGGRTFGEREIGTIELDDRPNTLKGIGDKSSGVFYPKNISNYRSLFEAAGWTEEEWPLIEKDCATPHFKTAIKLNDGSFLNVNQYYPQTKGLCSLFAARSLDGGINWRFVSNVNTKQSTARYEGYTEGSLALLDDGRIYCVFRNGGGGCPIYQAWSKDCGNNWSLEEPIDTRVRGIWPKLTLLSDGALAMSNGRPGIYLMFDPTATGENWEIADRIDIYENEKLTLSRNEKPDFFRKDLDRYLNVIYVDPQDIPWARKDILSGHFLSWENASYQELSPGRIMVVYDLQNWIEHPGAKPKKAIRGANVIKKIQEGQV